MNKIVELKENGSGIIRKAKVAGKLFFDGTKEAAVAPNTINTAAVMGLVQGLKYKGNLKRGAQGTLATVVILSGAKGIENVVREWGQVKRA